MLHVIGAGFPRTGTTSMKGALERLGFGPCYHMFELLTHPDHVDRWLPAASGEALDWDRVFDGYRSAQDWPASGFWREQAEAYPDAKIILTVRDPGPWYTSMQLLLSGGPDLVLPPDAPEAAIEFYATLTKLRPVLNLIGRAAFGDGWRPGEGLPDEQAAVEAFRRHVATVRESVPADRLLVFDVREGWEPLCRFLGVEVPQGEPFPHLNDSEALQEMRDRLVNEGEVASPFDPGRRS